MKIYRIFSIFSDNSSLTALNAASDPTTAMVPLLHINRLATISILTVVQGNTYLDTASRRSPNSLKFLAVVART